MGHFTSSTAYTISPRTEVLQLWQKVISEDAISCPFLAHGILAFSALHLASLRPSQREKYEQRCRRHQNEAIPEYRRVIQDIRPGIAGPVFAMASLVVLLGLATISDNALPKEDTLSRHRPDLTDVKALFTIVRGLEAVLKHGTAVWDTITNSCYRVAMTGHTAISGQVLELPVDVQLRYQQLMTDCLDSLLAREKSAKLACLDAIESLQGIHSELLFLVSENGSEEVELEPAYVVKWLALVPSEFVTLLQEENTAALIILGDFFALFQLLENMWFLKNVSTNALNAIQEVINPRGLVWLKGSEKQRMKLARQNLVIS
ncbi:hypothetical protein N7537_010867 [Penicillium hordei]|jgi:hypothetical protein|uniref:Uncharacterized protein n=1 Tax=Penicillium hordei TaxID=40994 RepID=A0AAD6DM77_9EURO|nr:uncharacterized protein N7537_010867 [Penicillium hordei]KAJ5588189.1 hypothetical protein N7537_010867 [Penicillium hordei]